tara:strand:+ start:7670 stop:9952 length:2283 start_codon:yes stop_codon:yes gene_type:complete
MDYTQKLLSDVVVYTKYAKYLPKEKRREDWDEIIDRYITMMIKKYGSPKDYKLHTEGGKMLGGQFTPLTMEILENSQYLYEKKVLPSMRALQFAGPGIEKNEARIYNCGYLPADDYRAFNELMFLLLGGTGDGYSVQFHHVENLPEITQPTKEAKYLIGDSIEGWADAVKQLMKSYFGITKVEPRFDYSDIRAKGERLVTAGGKAPGPEPLRICLTKIKAILKTKENGSKLTTLEVHDINCHIADAVLAGGIRRAALIALFSMGDKAMAEAKSSAVKSELISKEAVTYTSGKGLETDPNQISITFTQEGRMYKDVILHKVNGSFWDLEQYEATGTFGWWVANPQRGRSNNSATILRNRVKKDEFDTLWGYTVESGSGEPGIYFTNDPEYGTNPCCEISLRRNTFCNLCEINAGTIGDFLEDANFSSNANLLQLDKKKLELPLLQEDFNDRARVAAFFGTLQAGFTDFHYLRTIWKKNTEKDALIGVGITGICNGNLEDVNLREGAEIVISENNRVAMMIGIKNAARTTTIKPSGTTSCVVGTSSGIHAWHSEKYIRNMQCRVGDSLFNFFMEYHPELIKVMDNDANSAVIGIPQIAPDDAILREDENALQMLERVKRYNIEWVQAGHRRGPNTNNVSATVSVDKDEVYFNQLEEDGMVAYPLSANPMVKAVDGLEFFNEWDAVGDWMWKNKHTFNGLAVLPYNGGTYKDAPFMEVDEETFQRKLDYINNNKIDLTLIVEEEDNTTQKDNLACAGDACEIL